MTGNIVTFDVGASIKKQAALELERITTILEAIKELRAADAAAKADGLSEAGEYLALTRLTEAEDRVLKLISQPGFEICQRHLLAGLANVASGAA